MRGGRVSQSVSYLLAVLSGDLLALAHWLLDWNLLAALLRDLLTLLAISSTVSSVTSGADLLVGGGTLLLIGCFISS